MMDGGTKNGRIIPTNFGLKYNPPKLGIQYYFKENPKATFVHEVVLDDVDGKNKEDLINDLFTKHKKFVDPKVVSRNQLENLMERLKSNMSKETFAKNKENLHENANKVSKVDFEADIAQKEEQLIKPQNFEKDIFSGAGKEEFKSSDKKFMLDDFDMDNEDQKINDGHDMFEGLDDDLDDRKSKQIDASPAVEPESNDMKSDDNEEDDDSDAIDIDNEEELAARGLKKIQIEGEEEEFLMDNEGNIYNLNGDFIGTTNGDAEEENDVEDF
jgi:hypothetical protein